MAARYDLLLVASAGIAGLWWMHRRRRVRVRAERRACFDDCLGLIGSPVIGQDDVDFPVVRGSYRGFDTTLEAIADHVAMRKVPSLWLLATVRGALPYRGTLDLLVRPQNVEFYSPSSRLGHDLPIPRGWPEHALLRTDDPSAAPPLDLVAPHMDLFDDPRVKELTIGPGGVRIVVQARQARRAEYLVLRQAEFDDVRIEPELVSAVLERAVAIHAALAHVPGDHATA